MLSRHRVSRAAIELIKRFEGFRSDAVQLPDGRWMIGHGHTLTARAGAQVSADDAEALLLYDLMNVAQAISDSVYTPLTQNQFDALCSFVFNIGVGAFRQSGVCLRLNEGATVQAACAMELWRRAEFDGEAIVVDALVRRRAAEKALFLTPPGEAWVPAPTPMLRPLLDLTGEQIVPVDRPVHVETEQEGDQLALRLEVPLEDVSPAAMTAAAEAVTARLETLFQDDEPSYEGLASPEADVEPEAAPAPEAEPEARQQPAPAVEPEPLLFEDAPAPGSAPELDIPEAPMPADMAETLIEQRPFDLIPARTRPKPKPQESSLIWDLLLALFGLVFFAFGLFWGVSGGQASTGAVVTPLAVAWLAGLAGVGFVSVAVYRLLQRLGRAADRA